MAQNKSILSQPGVLMILFGIMLVVGGLVRVFTNPANLDALTATAADGVIVSVNKRSDGDDNLYRPTISFTDSDHISYEAKSVVEYSHRPGKGTKVTVRYDPRDPAGGCVIQGDEGLYHKSVLGRYLSIGGGVVAMGFGAWMFIDSKKKE